ncbi:hypothetical protein [Streptomyces sp. NPDC050416]|uniref:hypothetical protein n=1 Tax=Streptomyces sp. NPDC050416 TaxID=3365611 RepID=UPI00379BA77A
MDHRPRPSLTEHLTALDHTARQWDWHYARLGRPAYVRTCSSSRSTGTSTGAAAAAGGFAFVLVSDEGEIAGRLGGMHLYGDSPFTGFCFEIAADPVRERIYHLNRYGLFAWTATGVLAQRLDLEEKRFKLLKHFTLMDCRPHG